MTKGVTRSPINVILFSIISCGIYYYYWQYKVATEINSALNREAVKPVYVLIGIICFPFLLLHMYNADKAISDLCQERGVSYSGNGILWIVLTFFGIGMFVMEYQAQSALNDVWALDGGNAQ